MTAMASFHITKCYHLVSEQEAHMQQFWPAIARGRYSHCIMKKSLYYNLQFVNPDPNPNPKP